MPKLILRLLALALLCTVALPLRAEMVKSKGRGEITYTSLLRPSAAEERAAIRAAKLNALSRYAATLPKSRFELFRGVEAKLEARLDAIVPDHVVIDESTDKTSKRYMVTVEASINTTLLESELQAATKPVGATGATGAAAANSDSFIAFIFVARELASSRSFGPAVSTSSSISAINEVDRRTDRSRSDRGQLNSTAAADVAGRAVGASTTSGSAAVAAKGGQVRLDAAAAEASRSADGSAAAIEVASGTAQQRAGQASGTASSSSDSAGAFSGAAERTASASGTQSSSTQFAGRTEATSQVHTTESRGVETRAEDRQFRVYGVTAVNAAVNQVLTEAGYEAVQAVDAGIDAAAFNRDYGIGNDIAAETRTAAIKLCRDQSIAFLSTATLDVGVPEIDAATGLTRVYVTVTAQATDVRGRFPRTIASVSGKPYAGLGPNPMVARDNALLEAAQKTAAQLVDQLRVKRVP